MTFKEFMDLYDDWNGVTVVNDNNLNTIIKDRTVLVMKNKSLYNMEVIAFGFYGGELVVRVV